MKIPNSALLALSLALSPTAALRAQISIVDSGATGNQVNLSGTYVQDFDSLPSSTPPGTAWVNNSTIPGWYSSQSFITANGINSGLASYGTGSDRALGSVGAYWAIRLVNASSETITGLQIAYTGEQWYRGANNPQGVANMTFRYRIFDAGATEADQLFGIGGISGTTAVPELYFSSPNYSQTTGALLDGNADANSDQISYLLNGISLAPGQTIWLRWFSGSLLNNSHGLALDDLSISFVTIPEPASFAALAGLVGLAVVARQRRRS